LAQLEAVKMVLRLFSYLFHGVLALFLLVVSGFALTSGAPSLSLRMLPWTGSTLEWVVFLGALVGLSTVLLALRARLRLLFLLWSLAVAVLLLRGYFFSGYRFAPGTVSTALYLIAGSLVAVLGAWFQLVRRIERRY